MYQIYLPMVKFYREYLKELKKRGFLWCMFLLSRNAETEDLFVSVVKHWTSLDDVTGKKIAFVFSCSEREKRTAMIGAGGSAGAVNPFISKVPTEGTEFIWDPMETYFDEQYVMHMPKQSLAELHSQSITDMVEFLKISEVNVPSLVLTDLMTEKHYLVSITNNTNIYKVVKDITIELESIEKRWKYLKKIDDENKGACSRYLVYLNTKEKLEKRISLADENTKRILSNILKGEDYLKYKTELCFQNDKALRREVKAFVNQRRNFYMPYKDNERIVSIALEMAAHAEETDKQICKMAEDMSRRDRNADSGPAAAEQERLLKFVDDNLKNACIKLQRSTVYKNLSEDERTDYIYDILSTAGRDKGIHIEGQARQGRSKKGKQAGELDIIIKYKENPVSIVEAMNLKSVLRRRIGEHIEKLFGYDTAGNPVNYLISYVSVKNFEKFWIRYKDYIRSYDHKYHLISLDENTEPDFCYSDIRYVTAIHRRNGVKVCMVHIAVKMME